MSNRTLDHTFTERIEAVEKVLHNRESSHYSSFKIIFLNLSSNIYNNTFDFCPMSIRIMI